MMEIHINDDKRGIELVFVQELDFDQAERLKGYGFKQTLRTPTKWYATLHPAYIKYANELKDNLLKGNTFDSVNITPSYSSSKENIDKNKFSFVIIFYKEGEDPRQEEIVVFDPFKKVAESVAIDYAKNKYKEAFTGIQVYPRNYKREARKLLKSGKVLPAMELNNGTQSILNLPASNSAEKERVEQIEEIEEILEEQSKPASGRQTSFSKFDIVKRFSSASNSNEFYIVLDPAPTDRGIRLIHEIDFETNDPLKGQGLFFPIEELEKKCSQEELKSKQGYDFSDIDQLVIDVGNDSVLKAGSHYIQNGAAFIKTCLYKEGTYVQKRAKRLIDRAEKYIQEKAIPKTVDLLSNHVDPWVDESGNYTRQSAKERLTSIQIPLPIEAQMDIHVDIVKGHDHKYRYGIQLRSTWLRIKGFNFYPHVYGRLFDSYNDALKGALTFLSEKILLNSYAWDAVANYKDKLQEDTEDPITEEKPLTGDEEVVNYLDQVIAFMHDMYFNNERATKKKVEQIAQKLNVPNIGMMWEAAELSWLLWYRNIYFEKIPFKDRLGKMINFWNTAQPTYAYSDSSKEVYKQYSTPCPIGAILAEYTEVSKATAIFEPSAGNGLLLIGTDFSKVHANEVDRDRVGSLRYLGVGKVTSFNAAEPFPEELTNKYDVVLTNPPFARWEEDKTQKSFIVQKYFNKHVGLEKYMRLEHLMAGLALRTMKNEGKAGIVIMGHLYFGEDGMLKKYRPFFNWLYRHYKVDDVINMNSFKLYNKQGAIERTMLILIGGRKQKPEGVAPTRSDAPHLEEMVNSFSELWDRVRSHIEIDMETLMKQLKIEVER